MADNEERFIDFTRARLPSKYICSWSKNQPASPSVREVGSPSTRLWKSPYKEEKVSPQKSDLKRRLRLSSDFLLGDG